MSFSRTKQDDTNIYLRSYVPASMLTFSKLQNKITTLLFNYKMTDYNKLCVKRYLHIHVDTQG